MASGLDRLLAWAGEDARPAVADPSDRPVIVEDAACLRWLEALFDPAPGGDRRRVRPLAAPPRLLPPP